MKLSGSKPSKYRTIKVLLCLLACLVFLSAFCFAPAKEPLLTRYDLAVMLENLLQKYQVAVDESLLPEFSDLPVDQRHRIQQVLGLNIMAGFPDRTFRPFQPLANIETVFYLQSLTDFIRRVQPESYASRQFVRIFGFLSPTEALAQAGHSKIFPLELAESKAFVEKRVLEKLLDSILTGPDKKNLILKGRVTDAITGKPVKAFVAGANQAVMTDDSGSFALPIAGLSRGSVLLLATAENYQSIEMKKNMTVSDSVVFRLRPVKRQMVSR